MSTTHVPTGEKFNATVGQGNLNGRTPGQIRKQEESSGRFDFLKPSVYLSVISLILVLVCLTQILVSGFNYGVDFAGGTEIQVQFSSSVDTGSVRGFMDSLGLKSTVQEYGEENEFLIRVETIAGQTDRETNELLTETIRKITEGLAVTFSEQGPEVRRVDTVGPQVGSELKKRGILAGFYCLLLILIYIGLRFDYKYAPGAVVCLFHDAVMTLGIYALLGWEVNLQTMAAILTIIGYSLNDTIVIFDRIRENISIYRDKSLAWVANRSINDTLSRTILTSLTTFLTVGAMYYIATGVIQDFALTMMIGIVFGVYSTMYVATPLVLLVDRFETQAARRRAAQAARRT